MYNFQLNLKLSNTGDLMSKLIIKIKKDGTIEAETKGIKGKKCDDYVKIIEELTNSKTVNLEHTKEYYENEEENISNNTEKQLNY